MADTKYDGTVRHAIEFYGTTAVIPKSLSSFPGFIYSQDKARISFIVAAGTSWKKGLNTVYSTDPKIQDFNKAFSAANTKADWTKIKSYDFATNEAQPQNQTQAPTPYTPRPVAPNPTPQPNIPNNKAPEGVAEDPQKKKDKTLWYAAGAVGLFFLFNGKKKRRGR